MALDVLNGNQIYKINKSSVFHSPYGQIQKKEFGLPTLVRLLQLKKTTIVSKDLRELTWTKPQYLHTIKCLHRLGLNTLTILKTKKMFMSLFWRKESAVNSVEHLRQ